MQLKLSFIYSFVVVLILEQVVTGLLTDDGGSHTVKVTTKANSGVQTTKQPISSLVLKYTCSSSKEISIISVSGGQFNNVQVLKKQPGTGFCKKSDNTTVGFQTCITQNTDNGIVYLLYQQETNRELVAGKKFGYIKLTCDETVEVKEAKLELINKFGTTSAPDWKPFSPVHQSGDLKLIISPNSDLHVGDEVTLKMTINGAGYTISPQTCNATKDALGTSPVPIWNCHSVADANIISDVVWNPSDSQKSVSIKMLAFKFVDSENVYIHCSAKVCPSDNTDCKLDACTGHARKRRDLNNVTTGINIPVEHASVSMKVKDPLLNRSSGLTTIWYAHFVPVFVMVSARLYL